MIQIQSSGMHLKSCNSVVHSQVSSEGVLVGFCILTYFLYQFLEIDTDTLKGALVLFFTVCARLIPSAQAFTLRITP